MWTLFFDMHSGGGCKEEPYEHIYIEAPQEQAEIIFYNMFGHNPNRVSCTCCGPDYSISTEETLKKLTAYHRNCMFAYKNEKGEEVTIKEAWVSGKGLKEGYWAGYIEKADTTYNPKKKVISLEKYCNQKNVLIVTKKAIKPEHFKGILPEQGYVWRD